MYSMDVGYRIGTLESAKYFNDAFLHVCLYGWCFADTFLLSCACLAMFVCGLLLSYVLPFLPFMLYVGVFFMGGGIALR